MTEDRKDFEDWFSKFAFVSDPKAYLMYDYCGKYYISSETNLAWKAWQAAISRQKSDLGIVQ